MALTPDQRNVLISIERTTASISLLASIVLLATYLTFKEFRTLSNTILTLASPANILAGVAAVIGGAGLDNERGVTCQAQAFLLEWFMQADPFWSLVAAVTVFLVFFRRWSAERIKSLYWFYILFCYGLPSISAIVCLVYRNKNNRPLYGNATLWCWIDQDFAWARIYTYYAPIWISIMLSLTIYIAVGIRVYRTRSQLYDVRNAACYGSGLSRCSVKLTSPIMVQVDICTGSRSSSIIKYPDAVYSPSNMEFKESGTQTDMPGYTATAESPALIRPHRSPLSTIFAFTARTIKTSACEFKRTFKKWKTMDDVKYKYTKVASLFALSILITWVPASTNRLYGIVHPDGRFIYALNIGSALVLPLQGFWNAFIFFSTSLPTVKAVAEDVRAGRRMMFVGRVLGWETKEGVLPLVERKEARCVRLDSHTRLRGEMRGESRLDDESIESI